MTDEEKYIVFNNIGETYTRETLKAAIAQSKLNAAQINTILSANGLQGELLETTTDELANVVSTNMVTKAQKAASSSTRELGEAFKGLGMKIGSLIKAHPILTGIAVGIVAITAAYKIWTAVTVTLEEQKKKLDDAKNAYDNVKNKLQEINDELQNTKDAIKELEGTPNLSWVEKEELNRLREVTKELELQKRLKQDEQLAAAKELYKENVKTFDKEFKNASGTTSIPELVSQLISGERNYLQLHLNDNVPDMIAALQFLNEEKEKLTDEETIAEYANFIAILKLVFHTLNIKCILLQYMKLQHPPIKIRLSKKSCLIYYKDRLYKRVGYGCYRLRQMDFLNIPVKFMTRDATTRYSLSWLKSGFSGRPVPKLLFTERNIKKISLSYARQLP